MAVNRATGLYLHTEGREKRRRALWKTEGLKLTGTLLTSAVK
jgi:hypothetical protein